MCATSFCVSGCPSKVTVPLVGGGDVVDDADEGGFAGAVVTEQTEDVAALHVDAHIVEGGVRGEAFADVGGGENEIVHAGDFE